MRIYLLIIPVLFLLLSCGSKKTENPSIEYPQIKGILSPEQMIELFVSIHLTDATLTVVQSKTNERKEMSTAYYNYLYKKYNITKKDFERSLEFYSMNPESLELIYDSVQTRLSRLEAENSKKK